MVQDLPRTAGRYEIRRLLGRGGMASVHLARQPALARDVALKELHSTLVADAAAAHRFLRESRVAGALNHPSVVSVIEYFEHEGVPFIAMEYLERGSLRPLVGRLTLAQVAGVLDSVLGGLAEAASRGIVHRDLKPENVLVTADGHVKVADFGIAKAIGQVCMTDFRTATGQIVGTPAYMAPEQISGGEITPHVDLYATGLIAYELLAGRHAFHETEAPMALLMRHVNEDPPPLARVRPDLPPGVVAWVHAMLAKAPAARPAGAATAWDRLEGIVCDALGPRWRRDAILPAPGAPPVRAVEAPSRSEPSGIFSVVLPPLAAPPVHAATPEPLVTEPRAVEPSRSSRSRSREPRAVEPEPVQPEPSIAEPRRGARGLRRHVVAVALAGAVLLAIAGVMTRPRRATEPRAAQRPPAGPPLEPRLRDAVDARAAGRRAAVPASSRRWFRGGSLRRAGAALSRLMPTTDAALPAVRALRAGSPEERRLRGRAERALRAQADYLVVVRAALRLRASERQLDALGGLSSRLVSRLELDRDRDPASLRSPFAAPAGSSCG